MRIRMTLALALLVAAPSACSRTRDVEEAKENEAAEAPEQEAAEQPVSAAEGAMELPADLLARARVSPEEARAAAQAAVPTGKVVAGELEEEDGKLIFSFDIKVEGQEGIEEVHVDALTGQVIAQEHEGAEQEAAEAEGEKRE